MSKFKAFTAEVVAVLSDLAWRGFGLFLFVMGGAAGVGAIVSGSWLNGVITAWGTLMVGVIGALGYAIVTTGKATKDDTEKAMRDAIQKAQEQQKAEKQSKPAAEIPVASPVSPVEPVAPVAASIPPQDSTPTL